ncbi:unnamed protein product, partial [Mesorhabditis belari]|uniref:AB hydrolase-1 domain-containing protein n=1 Tax=Mesorhabditis belari TaxID=2138241 RepID=A0AAF3EWQ2_9BILA
MNDDGQLPLQLRREEQRLTKWGVFKQLLKACGLICYTACPPLPEQITRKLAFHPPTRGKSYQLRLLDESSNELVKKASKVHGRPFKIELMNQEETLNLTQNALFETTNFFTVETSYKNVLVGMHSAPQKARPPGQPYRQAVIFAQPNSSDLGWWAQPLCVNVPHLADLLECHMFAFDYSGFGCSTGSPSESNINNDIVAVYDYVRRTMPDAEIILMGYSIGTSCVIDLASKRPEELTGVVLIAPFASGFRLFQDVENVEAGMPPPCCMSFDRFRSVDKISLINVPTLICHGTLDTTVPLAHGKRLYSKLTNPVPMLIMHGADHSSIFTGARWETTARISRFLRYEAQTRDESKRVFVSDLVRRFNELDGSTWITTDPAFQVDGLMSEVNLNTQPIE